MPIERKPVVKTQSIRTIAVVLTTLMIPMLLRAQVLQASGTRFYSAAGPRFVRQALWDGCETEILNLDRLYPRDIEIDTQNQRLFWVETSEYWTEEPIDRIRTSDMGGAAKTTLPTPELDEIGDIAWDSTNGKLIVSGISTSYESVIWRCDPNGENWEDITPASHGGWVKGMTFDPISGRIFWTAGSQWSGYPADVWRANPDGTDASIVVPGIEPGGDICVDGTTGTVYWTETTGVGWYPYIVKQANLNGTSVTQTTSESFTGWITICVENPSQSLLLADDWGQIWRVDTQNGTTTIVCDEAVLESPSAIVFSATQQLAYLGRFGDSLEIITVDLTACTIEPIFVSGFGTRTVSSAIDFDEWRFFSGHSSSYYYDYRDGGVYTCTLDGTDRRYLHLADVTGMDIHPGLKKIYFATSEEGLFSCDYDGSNLESHPIGIDRGITGLTVDPVNDRIYVNLKDYNDPFGFWYCNLDGSFLTYIDYIWASRIAVDHTTQYVYFSSGGVQLAAGIYRTIPGSFEYEQIHQESPSGLEIDPLIQKIYWSDQDGGHRSDLDGANVEDLAGFYGSSSIMNPAPIFAQWPQDHILVLVEFANTYLFCPATNQPVSPTPTSNDHGLEDSCE